MKLKILSWNIWYDGYFDQITQLLNGADADIVGLQEVVPDDKSRDTIGFMKTLGYDCVFAPVLTIENDGRTMGNAIFSKIKIVDSKTYELSKDDYRNAVSATIKVGNVDLRVFSTHLLHTHQQPSEIQSLQADNLIKALPGSHAILMGDFNATPSSDAIQKIRKVIVDSDPSNAPTWSNYREGCEICNISTINTRLDYIFTSNDVGASNFKVLDSKGSDHLPIFVTIEL